MLRSVRARHSYQIQRRRFGDAEAGQACVRLPTMMSLVIEEMNERLPARLALRLAASDDVRSVHCFFVPAVTDGVAFVSILPRPAR